MRKGTLVKTGTSYKKKNNGDINKYYLICPECGCEYALDENNELEERTYFTKSYYLLNNLSKHELGLKRLSEETGLSQDMIKRCLSYFESRGMFTGECKRKIYKVDELLLHKFIKAVRNETNINEIKKWSVWESYNHFLFYRYNNDIIKEINAHCYQDLKSQIRVIDDRQVLIKSILEKLLNEDKTITIKNVCNEANISPEAVRLWGGNSLIAQMKEKQRNEKIIKLKGRVREMVDKYLLDNSSNKITSDGIYAYIGIRRNILWRSSPELTTYIGDILKKHNREICNKIN